MLTLIALSAVLMQEPPAPPAPPAPPGFHTRLMVLGSDGPGGVDKDGDGQISREEFAAPMNDHFARIDKNGDGRLSTDEMAAGHGPGDDNVIIHRGPGGGGGPGVGHVELRRPGPPGAHAEHEVRTMVFTGRGEGGPGEHEIVLRGLTGEGSARIIHTPGGAESPGESNVIIRQTGGPDGGNDMDADNDGRISEAEFTGPLREAFTRMDADHSGFIEQGERGPGHDVQVVTHRVETRQNRED